MRVRDLSAISCTLLVGLFGADRAGAQTGTLLLMFAGGLILLVIVGVFGLFESKWRR